MCELGFVDKSCFDKYGTGKTAIAKKLGYDETLYRPGNNDKVIGNYGPLVNTLYQEKKISESYYLELLNAIYILILLPR